MHLYGALALTTSCSSILKIICMLRDGIDVRIRRAWIGKTFGLVSYNIHFNSTNHSLVLPSRARIRND